MLFTVSKDAYATLQLTFSDVSDVYELHKAKKKIRFDLPVLIAFFVYSYAKLRMLQFYYDFLIKVLDPSDFELVEMDTG